MTPEITGLLDKAKQSAEAAQYLLADNYVDFAASRAYYAMFYALEALLLTKSLSFSKHSAVISAFGKEYIKSGIFDPCFHRAVIDAFDLRNAGDYGTIHAVSEALASQTIQNARELIQTIATHIEDIQRPKGFTLVEMTIVLVIVGLLIGLGSSMIGPLTTMSKVRESREIVESDMAAITGWAASNNRLPDTLGGVTDFISVAKRPTDAWGRTVIYLYDSNLAPASATKDTICGRKTTLVTVQTSDPVATVSNVAFVILNQGEDATTQVNIGGTPLISGAVAGTITVPAGTDDIVRWVTLDELRSRIGCQGAQLKIVNNELPPATVGSPYPSSTAGAVVNLIVDGGATSASTMRWCIEATSATPLPAGISFSSTNPTLPIRVTPAGTCASLPEASWGVVALAPNRLALSGTPAASTQGVYFFTLYVRDNNDAAGSNDNIASKVFVLTVNPSS